MGIIKIHKESDGLHVLLQGKVYDHPSLLAHRKNRGPVRGDEDNACFLI